MRAFVRYLRAPVLIPSLLLIIVLLMATSGMICFVQWLAPDIDIETDE